MLEREFLPSDDFPLPKNQPLTAGQVVNAISNFKRVFETHSQGKTDFPQLVLISITDGKKIRANLVNIFADTASQADGTFYFDRDVREPQGIRATNFLFGREIAAITILSSGETVTSVSGDEAE